MQEFARALDPTGAVLPALVVQSGARPGELAFVPFPRPTNPRLLLPVGAPRAAASSLRRRTEGTGPFRSGATSMMAALVSLGFLERPPVSRLTVGGRGVPLAEVPLLAHLAEVMGEELTVAARTSPQRPNGKPVLMLVSPDGRVLGYAKIGNNSLTRDLVRHEAEVLSSFVGREQRLSFDVPQVLHHSRFHDLEVLVVSCLPGGGRPNRVAARRAMREIAAFSGPEAMELAVSPFWLRMHERIAALSAENMSVRTIAATADTVGARLGHEQLLFGGWHGDWTPWNMVEHDNRLAVWDWERSTGTAPVGLDAVHELILVANHRGRLDQRGVRKIVDQAQGVISDVGQPSRHAPLIVVLGLLEMSLRFEEAHRTGMPVRNRYPALLAGALTALDESDYHARPQRLAVRHWAS